MPSAPPPPSRPPAPVADDAGEGGSFVLRFGTGVGAGTLAAAAATVPATLRVGSALPSGTATATVWAACLASTLFPMLLAVLVLRRARTGVRVLGGPDAAARSLGVAVWLFVLFLFEALFGSALRATTHHHALAGTTFAIVSVSGAVVLALLCARLSTIIATRDVAMRRFLLVALSGLLALAVVVAGLRFAHAFGASESGGSSPGALFVDLLAFAIAAAFASRPSLAQRRTLALVGPPIAATLFAIGVWSLHASASLVETIAARAPALGRLASVLGGH